MILISSVLCGKASPWKPVSAVFVVNMYLRYYWSILFMDEVMDEDIVMGVLFCFFCNHVEAMLWGWGALIMCSW